MVRIRSSSTTKETVGSDAVRSTDFTHLWRQLRAASWRSKRPSGLVNDWTYTSPNGDSLLGEHAVVVIDFQSGLLSEKDGSDSVESGDAELKATNETVTTSQIDTAVALSANAIDAVFGPDSDLSDTYSEQTNRELIVGAFQLLLSGTEPSAELEDVDDGEASGNDASAEAADRIVVATNDVNVLGDVDVASDYESIGSRGVKSSFNDNGKEDVEPREFPDEEVGSDEEGAIMDDAFIQYLGGQLTLEDMDQTTPREHE
ncbi:unnamed protein product [Phytophthora fragariaefolia]|uniref:Unnamed protein product n=1 Tax=Phytophthora fragariaefolia TaxID=1490495 RepID=A0A9W6Y4N1_9STRA|nr:unnamed protein product [Phytophthora fragariaefolia]